MHTPRASQLGLSSGRVLVNARWRIGGTLSVCVLAVMAALPACSGSTSSSGPTPVVDSGVRGSEPAGQACTQASQCYTALTSATADGGDAGAVHGDVTCITKVTDGYCTHTCAQDSDCCAVAGECLTGVKQVCSPFENQGAQYCLLSCEDADVQSAIGANANNGFYDGGATDAGSVADAYCKSFAGSATSCRSSGGGNKNRKVCIPQ